MSQGSGRNDSANTSYDANEVVKAAKRSFGISEDNLAVGLAMVTSITYEDAKERIKTDGDFLYYAIRTKEVIHHARRDKAKYQNLSDDAL